MLYKPTIGLEIHAELKTITKLFCNSKNNPDEKNPNVNVCPVCLGHPGTLPVINKEAIKHTLRVGVALGGSLADFTEFDRKNYFYPDIPKGYQISQYKYPLVSGGKLCDVAVTRVHLEEDTARSTHEKGKNYSLVDFNRAGVPLMELVTEPDIVSAEQASIFARELQLTLRSLGVSNANMEKGEMRVEANISVSPNDTFGTKVEVKNLNSFRAVERAIVFEIKRQTKLLEKGEEVVQETRGWDENKQQTFSQRAKEGSEDYRYFPEPDIPKFKISEIPEFSFNELKKSILELPWEKRDRYRNEYGIKEDDIEVFVQDSVLGELFEEVARAFSNNTKSIQVASNYITSDLVGLTRRGGEGAVANITPKSLTHLLEMVVESKVSSRGAKDILAKMFHDGGDSRVIAEKGGLFQTSDVGDLERVVEEVIQENKKVADDFKGGKESALKFLIGQGMKATKGSANPEVLKEVFLSKLV